MIPLEEQVTFAMIRAMKAHFRRSAPRLAELGLQLGQDMLLRLLWEKDGLSQSELIARLGVEPPTVTKAIGRLEKEGLVTRRRDPDDARVSRVHLTPRAKRLRDPVMQVWADMEARALAGLSEEERQTLRALSLRVRANLEAPYE
ncbi:MarR family transcriptional regulator [Pendulispora rubella]|uniref:MarR family transcriptional regulator n=1 Tax=Pendulispora rubella TaxID=2741070 RepID=A0ABZ2LCC3_9BACT